MVPHGGPALHEDWWLEKGGMGGSWSDGWGEGRPCWRLGQETSRDRDVVWSDLSLHFAGCHPLILPKSVCSPEAGVFGAGRN